jgi:hypothetical protein
MGLVNLRFLANLTFCDQRGRGRGFPDRIFSYRIFANRHLPNWSLLIDRLRMRKICGSGRTDQSQARDSGD